MRDFNRSSTDPHLPTPSSAPFSPTRPTTNTFLYSFETSRQREGCLILILCSKKKLWLPSTSFVVLGRDSVVCCDKVHTPMSNVGGSTSLTWSFQVAKNDLCRCTREQSRGSGLQITQVRNCWAFWTVMLLLAWFGCMFWGNGSNTMFLLFSFLWNKKQLQRSV